MILTVQLLFSLYICSLINLSNILSTYVVTNNILSWFKCDF